MKVAKKVREQLGLNPWKMAQKMGRSIQSYVMLEREVINPKLADLFYFYDIATHDLGWSAENFMSELRTDMKAKKCLKKTRD